MTMNESFATLSQRLEQREDVDLGRGATPDELREAEVALNLRFKGSYRSFLERFGWGEVGHFEVYGLGAGRPNFLDLIKVTRSERSEATPALPVHLLPIMNNGGGSHYCLDTQSGDEPQVVFWDHEQGADQKPVQEAVDFSAWLGELLDDLD